MVGAVAPQGGREAADQRRPFADGDRRLNVDIVELAAMAWFARIEQREVGPAYQDGPNGEPGIREGLGAMVEAGIPPYRWRRVMSG